MKYQILQFIHRKVGAKILSKWIVLAFDLMVTVVTYGIAYILRFNFTIEEISLNTFLHDLLFSTAVFFIAFLITNSYEGIIRHSGIADAYRLIQSGLLAFIFSSLLWSANTFAQFSFISLPLSISIIHVVLNISLLIISRFGIRSLFYQTGNKPKGNVTVLIYGAGKFTSAMLRSLKEDDNRSYEIAGFIETDEKKIGKTIEGIKIYPVRRIAWLIEKYQVGEFILSDPHLHFTIKNQIIDTCINRKVSVKHLPPMEDWINGKLSSEQMKSVRIEELMEREQIVTDTKNISENLRNKVIMVTGAAGSIGSEIVRQILEYEPAKLILVDQAESGLYDLQMELWFKLQLMQEDSLQCVVADITHKNRMEILFTKYHPHFVFHAAAYKHVPLMEHQPVEASHVNIIGTKNLIDLAIAYDVQKFVFISTDKAVNPTNVMGATKRCAEMYVQAASKKNKTVFITTRFGNVLGSNGSVIPLFKKQIENGGPITITHPEITRYFMTISEACQLVLQAAAFGNGGEIFLFDMGQRVQIYELARKMVLLSGLMPGKDIEFLYTGLRPGEKLHEELLTQYENTLPTPHPKITVAQTDLKHPEKVYQTIELIEQAINENHQSQVVMLLKQLLPEYISKNSEFSALDNKNSQN